MSENVPRPAEIDVGGQFDLVELAKTRADVNGGIAYLEQQKRELTRLIKREFERLVGQKIKVGGVADQWVEQASGNFDFVPFPNWDEPQVDQVIPFGEYELVRTCGFSDGEDEDGGLDIIIIVPELGDKQQVIIELDKLSFEPEALAK
jgi:hypothetical protein